MPTDMETFLYEMDQYGLAADGSDLRDSYAALAALTAENEKLRKERDHFADLATVRAPEDAPPETFVYERDRANAAEAAGAAKDTEIETLRKELDDAKESRAAGTQNFLTMQNTANGFLRDLTALRARVLEVIEAAIEAGTHKTIVRVPDRYETNNWTSKEADLLIPLRDELRNKG